MLNKEDLSREEYVYLAKLYEKAEKGDEAIEFIKCFVNLNPDLTKEERMVLSSGYKFKISQKRNSWRLLNAAEKKEMKKSESENLKAILETKSKVEDEMRDIILDLQDLLDNVLLPKATKNVSKVYFLRLKGDYLRYLAEFTSPQDQEEVITQAEIAYNESYELAEQHLQISNVNRLGIALNFSIFLYETRGLKEDAIVIAKTAFEESMKVLGELEKNKNREAILIIQILKENLLIWTTELNDEEGEN